MKKIILIIIILILLTGCSGIYSLNGFVLPDDSEFLALIEELNTPKKACQYMLDNFETEDHPYTTLTPYQLYLLKKGDCDDFDAFVRFMANYHCYKTYQILMLFPKPIYPVDTWHAIAVFKEGDYYTFSENQYYNPYDKCYNSFNEIVQIFNGWTKYIVHDYDGNIVETRYNN